LFDWTEPGLQRIAVPVFLRCALLLRYSAAAHIGAATVPSNVYEGCLSVNVKLSIAIVSYNTREYLARCLETIGQNAPGDLAYEIIVVDNRSRDGSADMIRERFPAVRLIVPPQNTFYSEGNNIAIRAASGEYVLVLNPDTEVHAGMLGLMLQQMDDNPDWGLATARQIWTDGFTTLPICSRFNTYADLWLNTTLLGVLLPGWRKRRRAQMWYEGWDRLSSRPVQVAPGSCMMIRRAVVDAVGLFDASMPFYFSDDDLCKRMALAGYTVQYLAEATITHVESASMNQVRGIAKRAYYRDVGAYARKYYGPVRAALLMIFATPTRWAINLAAQFQRS
jgi:N-acetylglucosaminyl-diphospho-decaprenol L-rhamnosyltransferase